MGARNELQMLSIGNALFDGQDDETAGGEPKEHSNESTQEQIRENFIKKFFLPGRTSSILHGVGWFIIGQ